MQEAFKFQINLTQKCGILKSRPLFWKILHVIAICTMCYDLFTCITFIQRNHSDVVQTAEAIVSVITCPLGLTKFIFMIIFSKEIYEVIEYLQDLNSKCE